MVLSEHFSQEEFTFSSTAVRHGIDNSIPQILMPNALATVRMMEGIRDFLCHVAGRDIPIRITSGYRCPELNTLIGSKPTSAHVQASACDWKAPEFGSAYQICRVLSGAVNELQIGQLIYEYDSWVHTATVPPMKLINRILTVDHRGTHVGIVREPEHA